MQYVSKYLFVIINVLYFYNILSFEIYTHKDENHIIRKDLNRVLKKHKRKIDVKGSLLQGKPCEVGLLHCKEEEICKTNQDSQEGFCECKDGWIRKTDENCEKMITQSNFINKNCEIGMLHCTENEVCKPINKRRKNGLCKCRDGFKRNDEGLCIKILQNSTVDLSLTTSNFPIVNENEYPKQTQSSSLSTYDHSIYSKTTATPTEHIVKKVIVNINNKTITLPEGVKCYKEWTTLSAYAIGASEEKYNYIWTLLDRPTTKEEGAIRNMNSPTVSLSNLVAGVYILKVTVDGLNAHGEATGNITVVPAKHSNKPPVAVIVPASQVDKLPNSIVIFDGSGSSDDTKITSYQWELVMGPLGYKLKEATGPTLQMTNLLPGNYTIMLKVKDDDGAEGNATASLVIVKETDYPPTANAGGDKIIYLPQTDIILNGNASTDDHGIVEWEWTKGPEDSGNAVDMQDTRKPYLKLSNLEKGHYHFILKVIDTLKQSANSSAHVYVHASSDNLLQANAGENVTLKIPNTTVVLDASKSTGISVDTHAEWKQISGPSNAHFSAVDKVVVNASDLTRGVYVFQVTLWNAEDKDKFSSSNITVKVIQDKNAPPVARAGTDFSVTLPVSVVIVNGSASSDDVAITKWMWKRDPTSLAAGSVVKNSDQTPVLLFTGVIPGRYVWNLTVWDDQGASSSDTVSIIVKDGPNHLNEVEMVVGIGIENLSVSQLNNLLQKLQLLLHSSSEVTLNINQIYGVPLSGRVSLVMLGHRNGKILSGPALSRQLKSKTTTGSNTKILDLPIISVDTVVCQNNCSGHGECIQSSKECRCRTWWMESSFRRRLGDGTPNCDWSVVYVFICSIGVALLCGILIWVIFKFLAKNAKQFRGRKKNPKYSLLDANEEGLKVKQRIPGSLLDSESDTESESEILFDTRKSSRKKIDKLKNGHIKLQRLRT